MVVNYVTGPERAEQGVVAEIRQAGGEAIAIHTPTWSKRDQVQAMFRSAGDHASAASTSWSTTPGCSAMRRCTR